MISKQRDSVLPVLEMKDISKQYFGFYALKNVNLNVGQGEVHSLLGENGAGKSTLIKIMAGVNSLDQGQLLINGEEVNFKNPRDAYEHGINVVFQELNIVPNLSIAENIFFGRLPSKSFGRVDWKRLYEESSELLREVGLDVDPRLKTSHLALGQQQLVEIAKALAHDSKVIALDEPTSSLTNKEIERLFELIEDLKSKGVGIVYVSHKLDELFRICDRITVLRDGDKVGEINTAEASRDQLISMMVGRELKNLYPKVKAKVKDILLNVQGLTSSKVKNISFTARRGEIIGFSGLMGSGRTELAKALFGIDRTFSGEVSIDDQLIPRNSPVESRNHGIGYIPEDRKQEGLFLNSSVRNNMTISILRDFFNNIKLDDRKERSVVTESITRFQVKAQSMEQKIISLSGGNQQKVILARWLLKNNLKVLILDEPTRGIDVGSKSEIYRLISELALQGVAVLIMSSEMPELLSMCDRIYIMREGKITGEFNASEATQEQLMNKAIGNQLTSYTTSDDTEQNQLINEVIGGQ